jgi:hypothetical protein
MNSGQIKDHIVLQTDLMYAYFMAGKNWIDWRDCFESHPQMPLPVLTDDVRFRKFVSEYSLLRKLNKHQRDETRHWLQQRLSVDSLVKSENGEGIDGALDQMTKIGFRREISLLSKLAAFARPSNFIAYDQYAVRATREFIGQPITTYASYLYSVRILRDGAIGRTITRFLEGKLIPTKDRKAFELRMLDVCLMLEGGAVAKN